MNKTNGHIVIFKTEDGKISVDARFDAESVWLSLDQMAILFERDKSTISRHIKNVFSEGELEQNAVVANFATTAADGKVYQFEIYRAKEMQELESDFDRMLKEIEKAKGPHSS